MNNDLRRKDGDLRRQIQDRFRITHVDGHELVAGKDDAVVVDLQAMLRGSTPFYDLNHYLLVTPRKGSVGVDYVQETPANITANGIWTGEAKFGQAGVGSGETFEVRLLATSERLTPGPLAGC